MKKDDAIGYEIYRFDEAQKEFTLLQELSPGTGNTFPVGPVAHMNGKVYMVLNLNGTRGVYKMSGAIGSETIQLLGVFGNFQQALGEVIFTRMLHPNEVNLFLKNK